MKTAIFPGSFNPFTKGHEHILTRSLALFDKIIIGIGRNTAKSENNAEQRKVEIKRIFYNEPRIEVAIYDGLTVDFAKSVGAQFILRGIRTLDDFKYEQEIAEANKVLSGIETIFLFADPDKKRISSSLIRELEKFGKDISDYVP